MMNFHKKSHEVPGLNTSSLPDLIFSVLFFFMIVTHMRQVTLKVDCRLPQGKELTRLTKKSADRKSTRLNSSHVRTSRMPSSA